MPECAMRTMNSLKLQPECINQIIHEDWDFKTYDEVISDAGWAITINKGKQ